MVFLVMNKTHSYVAEEGVCSVYSAQVAGAQFCLGLPKASNHRTVTV